jgi:hypothetical protein
MSRAVDAKPYPEDWCIYIERADEFYVDVSAADNDMFSVDCAEGGRRLTTTRPLDAARLKAMLVRHLNADKKWRGDGQGSRRSRRRQRRASRATDRRRRAGR